MTSRRRNIPPAGRPPDSLFWAAVAVVWWFAAGFVVAQETAPTVMLETACLEPVQFAALAEVARSTVVAVTGNRAYVYEIREAEGRWMLIVRRGPDAACVVAQGTEIHYPGR